MYSGDFSSELSRQLKKNFGEDFVSVYLAGASGDINHIDFIHKTQSDYKEIGKALAKEAVQIICNEENDFEPGMLQTSMQVISCKYRRASRKALDAAKKNLAQSQSDAYTMLGNTQDELLLDYERKMNALGSDVGLLMIHVIMLGTLAIFSLPGEMYHQFGERIKDSRPGRNCLIATLSNGEYGYLPVPELMDSDVYPAQLCEGSKWEAAAGDMVTDTAISMAHLLES